MSTTSDSKTCCHRVVIRRMQPVTIRPHAAHGCAVATRSAVGNEQDDRRGEDRTDDLSHHVSARVLGVDLAGEKDTQRDCRVHVAAGDRPDRIHHREQRKPKGEGYAGKANMTPRQYSTTDAPENQDKCTHQFREIFIHGRLLLKRFHKRCECEDRAIFAICAASIVKPL